MYHHGTIRKYTAALLDLFNNLEVQSNDKAGTLIVKTVPIIYDANEKSQLLDTHSAEQLRGGNFNVLPKASLSMSSISKIDQRTMNKNNKIGTKSNANTMDYMYNSVPYEFTYEVSVLCRGMNQCTQIVEQVAPWFNPILNIDIWDADNLNVPTRIPVKLLDISIENQGYDEFSSNLVTVSFGLSITGSIYAPIQSVEKIKKFMININDVNNLDGLTFSSPANPNGVPSTFNRKIILGWDVNASSALTNATDVQVQNVNDYPPNIIDVVALTPVILGQSQLEVIYSDLNNKQSELTIQWSLLIGTGTITQDNVNHAKAILDVTSGNPGSAVNVQVTITDPFGLSSTINKQFVL